MPSHFAKDQDSNNYKLLSLIAQGSEETRTVYGTMLKFWDVDQSEGVGLDRLGKDEGISRGAWDDEEYRKMIKIQCITNLSDGDIPTMNMILDAYLGDDFIGLQDGYIDFEPASLLLHVKEKSHSIPDNLIQRIKPAGVKIYVLLSHLVDIIKIYVGTYDWRLTGRMCGRFHTAARPGVIGLSPSLEKAFVYSWDIHSKVTGRFKAGGGIR